MSKIKRTIREHIKDYLYNYDWLEEELVEEVEEIERLDTENQDSQIAEILQRKTDLVLQ